MARIPRSINSAAEASIVALVARAREIARESFAILQQSSRPDTFLGRKTQEPFPKEKTETR